MCQSPRRCTFPSCCCFFTHPFRAGRATWRYPGSVSPAIPLTRLRIVVLAREEGQRHRCMSPVVRVSAYLPWDFGASRARERKGERERGRTNSRERYVQRKCNAESEEFDSSKKRRRRNPSPEGTNYRAFRCSYRALSLIRRKRQRSTWYWLSLVFDGRLLLNLVSFYFNENFSIKSCLILLLYFIISSIMTAYMHNQELLI